MIKMLLAVGYVFATAFVIATLQTGVRAEPSAAEEKGTPEKHNLKKHDASKLNKERGTEGAEGKRPGPESRGHSSGKHPMADMSNEERESVRRALQAVWEKAEVMQARDEVKRATETLHQAIKKAVEQEDPKVAALLARMNVGRKSKGDRDKRRPGSDNRDGRPPMGKPTGAGEGDHGRSMGGERRGIGPAGFMVFSGDFSDEEKKRLEAARKKAVESEAFRKVEQDLRSLLKQGEDLRRKRVETFHQTRMEMTKAMIKADPQVKPLLERMKERKPPQPKPDRPAQQ